MWDTLVATYGLPVLFALAWFQERQINRDMTERLMTAYVSVATSIEGFKNILTQVLSKTE